MWIRRLTQLSLHLCSTIKKPNYYFQYGSHMIPHPQKVYKGGEDAFYASTNFLAVADGVGGWADHGVDPGLYSKKLCKIIRQLTVKQPSKYIDNPKQLLIDAVQRNKQIGSTTACIACLNPQNGNIKIYYIGDSVYARIKRDGKTFCAQQQQKSFNFPYQIGSIGDDPSQGILHQYTNEEINNEVIVLATDGLWDNLLLNKLIDNTVNHWDNLKKISQTNANEAYKCSLSQNYESPFYKKAIKAKYRYPKVGKPDDITILSAKVQKKM